MRDDHGTPDGQVEEVEVGRINVREWPGAIRCAPTAGETRSLADSITQDGLLQAVGVRRLEDGGLELLWGHRRLAAFRSLGLPTIKAKVIDNLSPEQAESTVLAENLFRGALTYLEKACWIKRWLEINGRAAGDEIAVGPNPAAKGKPISKGRREKRKSHRKAVERLAEKVGVSDKSIYRSERAAEAFTPEQASGLNGNPAVNQAVVLSLADLEPPLRDEAVALIVGGAPPREAIRAVSADGQEDEVVGVVEGEEVAHRELTDEEWLDLECGRPDDPARVRSKVRRLDLFDREAILYRKISEDQLALGNKLRKELTGARRAGGLGPCSYIVNDFLSIAHPRDWLACDTCSGQGVQAPRYDGQGAEHACPSCLGDGFVTRKQPPSPRRLVKGWRKKPTAKPASGADELGGRNGDPSTTTCSTPAAL